jgi:hypothetical protein
MIGCPSRVTVLTADHALRLLRVPLCVALVSQRDLEAE